MEVKAVLHFAQDDAKVMKFDDLKDMYAYADNHGGYYTVEPIEKDMYYEADYVIRFSDVLIGN